MAHDAIQNNLEAYGDSTPPNPKHYAKEESPFTPELTPMNSRVYIMGDRTYQVMKQMTQVVLPALATFYFAMTQIWNLPLGIEVVGTITAICTFLGVSLGISTHAYNKTDEKYDGRIVINEDDNKKNYQLVLKNDPDTIDQSKEILFKVDKME